MKVRKLRNWKQADGGPLRELDRQCFPAPDISFYNDSKYHWWVGLSEPDAITVAYVGLSIPPTGHTRLKRVPTYKHAVATLYRIGVWSCRRSGGDATKLLKAAIRWCRMNRVARIKTYCSSENKASIGLFTKAGFKRRKSRDGAWVHFTKELG